MTGTVSWETLLWVIGSNATVLLVAWRILSWVGGQFKDRDLKIEAESARAKMVEKALEAALQELRVHLAERYATKDGMTTALSRIEESVKEVKDLMHQMLLSQSETGGRQPPRTRG